MSRKDNGDASKRLNQVIADYLAVVEAGAVPDRDELLSQYPELSGELKSFFADHD